jgi:hypothetical protein
MTKDIPNFIPMFDEDTGTWFNSAKLVKELISLKCPLDEIEKITTYEQMLWKVKFARMFALPKNENDNQIK